MLLVPEDDPSPCKVVRAHFHPHFIARQNADVVHAHFPGNSGQNLVVIFQFYLEHSIAERFYYGSVLFNECLFSHNFGSAKIGGFI